MKNQVLVKTQTSPVETFAAAMGIAKQRELEIDKLVDRCHRDTSTYPDAIAAVSINLLNANELAYASFHLGAFAESQRTKQEIIEKLLDN
jgi:hypothetical protein